jgi:hypothetical protein
MSERTAGAMDGTTDDGLAERNRRVLRTLLTIVAVLVVASLLVGIRW